jgi:hypothetical protein
MIVENNIRSEIRPVKNPFFNKNSFWLLGVNSGQSDHPVPIQIDHVLPI